MRARLSHKESLRVSDKEYNIRFSISVMCIHYIQSYSSKCAFIAAQSPMEQTKNDIWELIWQFRTSTIVLLCDFREGNEVN